MFQHPYTCNMSRTVTLCWRVWQWVTVYVSRCICHVMFFPWTCAWTFTVLLCISNKGWQCMCHGVFDLPCLSCLYFFKHTQWTTVYVYFSAYQCMYHDVAVTVIMPCNVFLGTTWCKINDIGCWRENIAGNRIWIQNPQPSLHRGQRCNSMICHHGWCCYPLCSQEAFLWLFLCSFGIVCSSIYTPVHKVTGPKIYILAQYECFTGRLADSVE